ncbi:2OG-Fe(II) oxygenase [Paraburkholderia aspalathi]|uniref:2OG-Fe(II) oxygenase n=1 Tax=Paraburkholderia aspalathi TaxID=1324617 RepID=UPI0038BE1100
MQVVDASWETWLSNNVARGCSIDSMIDAMVQAGFTTEAARAEVHKAFRIDPANAVDSRQSATEVMRVRTTPQTYQYDESPVARGNVIRAHDRNARVLMRCERPQVIVFGDVLSPDECDEMIERSRHRLKRSTTVNPATGKEDVILNRTSEGIWYQRGEDAFIEKMDRRISSLMNWPVENGEGLQILHYGTTGEYRPHFDYFPPDQPGSAVHTDQGGQRVSTLLVYLNDVPDGGETIFPEAGMSVAAVKGGAVYFRYMNGQRQLDPLTLHGGAPVLGGDKWIMAKWMRERAYG